MRKILQFGGILMLSIAVGSCLNDTDDAVALSGTISAESGSATDSDVNDPRAPYASNNSPAQAQVLPNPVIVGGFVTMPGMVSVGRFADSDTGDVNDYYSMTLLEGQTVTLTIGDPSGENSVYQIGGQSNNIELHLLDSNQTVIASTINNADPEDNSVTAPASGQYYLQVQATFGASDYLLSTGATVCQSAAVLDNADLNINDEFVPGEVIVKFKNNSAAAAVGINAVYGDFLTYQTTKLKALDLQAKAGAPGRSVLMTLDAASRNPQALSSARAVADAAQEQLQFKLQTLQTVKALRARDDVEYAKPNYIRYPTRIPNDTDYATAQWNLPLINLPQAWDVTTGSSDVIVAVIDSGIAAGHPDLGAARLVAGADFIRDVANAADGDGVDIDPNDPSEYHGTHVAGIIAAHTNNSLGMAGIAWDVRIMPLRALGAMGGTDYDIEQAVLYASGLPNDAETPEQTAARVNAGLVADVINLSLGGATATTVAPEAFRLARERGVIIVAAAGNEGSCGLSYPASLDGVVSVSAVDRDKVATGYSNRGSTIDVAAPGGSSAGGVYSLWVENRLGVLQYRYESLQGTSMAAPHVAGMVALMKAANSNLTPAHFDNLLARGELTEDLGEPGRDDVYGNGLIDASRAVQAANLQPEELDPAPSVSPLSLQFDPGVNQAVFNLSNSGGGSLTASMPGNLEPWLSITPGADVDSSGLGPYTVSIDRGLLPQQPTVGMVVKIAYVATNAQNAVSNGTLDLPVLVYNQGFSASAGYQYVLLYRVDSLDDAQPKPFRLAAAAPSAGRYAYTFSKVPAGRYVITAGSDLNNNGYLNDRPDAKGDYPILGRMAEVVVGSSHIRGLDFTTGYYLYYLNRTYTLSGRI